MNTADTMKPDPRIRFIDPDEYERVWLPRARRIFPDTLIHLIVNHGEPLVDDGPFRENHGPYAKDGVYAGLPLRREDLFVPRHWQIVAIPQELGHTGTGSLGVDELDPGDPDDFKVRNELVILGDALRRQGIRDFVIAPEPGQYATAIKDLPMRPQVRSVDSMGWSYHDDAFTGFSPVVFTASCDWGIRSMSENIRYSFVAGEERIMAEIVANYGGLDAMRRRFWDYHLMIRHEPPAPGQFWCQVWQMIGWGPVPYERP